MTFTLSDLVYRTARELGILREGTATDGSNTTIVDTVFRTEANDYWNNGSAFIVYDAAGLGAAPEGQYKVITDSTSAGTLTLQNALTAAVAVGDRYAIARKAPGNTPWIDIIIQKVNQSLQAFGPIATQDTTSLVIANDQTEYSLPSSTANMELLQVWIQGDNTDPNDNLWIEIPNWKVENQAPGVAATLILPRQFSADYYLKLVYMANHPELQAYNDVMSEFIPVEAIVYPAIRDCFVYMKQVWERDQWDSDIARWERMAADVIARRPMNRPRKANHILYVDWPTNIPYNDPNVPTTVRLV